jgi:hypothetical protein
MMSFSCRAVLDEVQDQLSQISSILDSPNRVMSHSMASFFDKYLTPISVGFPPVEVLATGGLALSIVE